MGNDPARPREFTMEKFSSDMGEGFSAFKAFATVSGRQYTLYVNTVYFPQIDSKQAEQTFLNIIKQQQQR